MFDFRMAVANAVMIIKVPKYTIIKWSFNSKYFATILVYLENLLPENPQLFLLFFPFQQKRNLFAATTKILTQLFRICIIKVKLVCDELLATGEKSQNFLLFFTCCKKYCGTSL